MGLDGGTYITRSDVLRGQSWAVNQADDTKSTRGGAVGSTRVFKKRRLGGTAAREVQWTTCKLSGAPLSPPVVADFLGCLYNKDAVLNFLLGKKGSFADDQALYRHMNQLREGATGAYDHLATTRDVVEVQLPALVAQGGACRQCPVSEVSCLSAPFAALAPCGHVFSERAIKEMRTGAGAGDGACALCERTFAQGDVLPLCATAAEVVERLREQLPQRRQWQKHARKQRAKVADHA